MNGRLLLFILSMMTMIIIADDAVAEFKSRCDRLYNGDMDRCNRQYERLCSNVNLGDRRNARYRICESYLLYKQQPQSDAAAEPQMDDQAATSTDVEQAPSDDEKGGSAKGNGHRGHHRGGRKKWWQRYNCSRTEQPDEAPQCKAWRNKPRVKYNCTKEEVEDEQPECASWRAKRAERRQMSNLNEKLNRRAERRLRNRARAQAFASPRRRPGWSRRAEKAKAQKTEMEINNSNNDTVYFQGDVDLSPEQLQTLVDESDDDSDGNRKKRKVGAQPMYNLWDKMPISYHFGSGIRGGTQSNIRKAIKLWESNTCVRFRENGPHTDRLEFYDGSGCSSFVGQIGGTQQVSISVPGCDVVGIISHEIGHALGFFHEQARPDSSKYIDINYSNIPAYRYNNFLPLKTREVDYHGQKYDYGSVMHYDGYGFAKSKSSPSIETTDARYQYTIGQRIEPSFIDYAQINDAYCKSKCGGTNINCEHRGYVDPNDCSKCKCPSGFGGKRCEEVAYSKCGGELKVYSTPNYIESPGYPNRFNIGDECIWLLKTDGPTDKIKMEFDGTFSFSCKEVCDESYVEIKDNDDWTRTGFRICCQKPDDVFESQSNEMIVIFKVNEGSTHSGFRAKVWSDTAASAPGGGGGRRPMPVTLSTPKPTRPTTTEPDINPTTNKPGCKCSEWSGWSVTCTQNCGGCGEQMRQRNCNQQECFDIEKRKCNFEPCPSNQRVLFANGKLNILVNGCCVGLFQGRDRLCNAGLEGAIRTLFDSFLGESVNADAAQATQGGTNTFFGRGGLISQFTNRGG